MDFPVEGTAHGVAHGSPKSLYYMGGTLHTRYYDNKAVCSFVTVQDVPDYPPTPPAQPKPWYSTYCTDPVLQDRPRQPYEIPIQLIQQRQGAFPVAIGCESTMCSIRVQLLRVERSSQRKNQDGLDDDHSPSLIGREIGVLSVFL